MGVPTGWSSTQSKMYLGIQNVKRMPKVIEIPHITSFEYCRTVIWVPSNRHLRTEIEDNIDNCHKRTTFMREKWLKRNPRDILGKSTVQTYTVKSFVITVQHSNYGSDPETGPPFRAGPFRFEFRVTKRLKSCRIPDSIPAIKNWTDYFMERLDQSHLHPKLEFPELTCPGRDSNPGLLRGRRAL